MESPLLTAISAELTHDGPCSRKTDSRWALHSAARDGPSSVSRWCHTLRPHSPGVTRLTPRGHRDPSHRGLLLGPLQPGPGCAVGRRQHLNGLERLLDTARSQQAPVRPGLHGEGLREDFNKEMEETKKSHSELKTTVTEMKFQGKD